MNQSGQDEREELVMRVIEGELSLDSSEVLERMATDPELRRAIEDAMNLRRALDVAAETVRQGAHTEVALEGPGAERARAVVRGLAAAAQVTSAESRVPQRRPRFPRWVWLVAASLLAIFALTRRPVETEPVPRGRMTLGSSLHGLYPSGKVDRFGPFRWSFDEIGAGRFEVRILRAETGELVTMKRGLKRAIWQPEPEHTREWPSKIRWVVSAYDASGALLESKEASAERSSR